jgi:hypothetical protein
MHVAYTRPDGGVSVIFPAPKAQLPDESDEAFLARVREAVPPDAKDVTEVSPADIPTRAYRNAWRLSGGRVQHDMSVARALKMAEIRAERDARLAATDGPFLRAQEHGNQAEIERLKSLRQRLRDIPQTTRLAEVTDPDALKAFAPEWPK